MQGAGFTGFVRGERGSTTENLTSLEYKIKQEQKKLAELSERIADEQVRYDRNHDSFMTFSEIDSSGKNPLRASTPYQQRNIKADNACKTKLCGGVRCAKTTG